MKTKFTRIIYFIIWIFLSNCILAQSNYNLDFEQGSLNGWQFSADGQNVSTPISGRHELTSGSGTDPFGGFPIVAPNGGKYSFKLGNSSTGAEWETASFKLHVPNGITALIISYSSVLQDGGHEPLVQPRFEVVAIDSSSGLELNCSDWKFVVGSTLGYTVSSVSSNVYYRSWSDITLNLSNYEGKTIIVNFKSSDCLGGGHFGYNYIDLSIRNYETTGFGCKGDNFLSVSAPPGFQTYTWWTEKFTDIIGTGQNAKLNNDGKKQKVIVTMDPFDGFGCPDTLEKEILVSDLSIIKFPKDTSICRLQKLNFNPQIYCDKAYGPISYNWQFNSGGNFSCTNCINTIFNSDSVTGRTLFEVKDAIGCVRKASSLISIYAKGQILIQPLPIYACEKTLAKLSILAEGPGILRYQWFHDGIAIKNATKDSLVFSSLGVKDFGLYQCQVYSKCDTFWSKKVEVNVKNRLSVITSSTSLTSCEKDGIHLKANLYGTGPFETKWFHGKSSLSTSDSSYFIPSANLADSGLYHFYASGQCNDTVTPNINVTIYHKPVSNFVVNKNPQCEKGNFAIFTNKSKIVKGTLNCLWKTDTIDESTNLIKSNLPIGDNLIRLIVISERGCLDSSDMNMVINETPKPKIYVNKLNQCNPGNFEINDFTITNNGPSTPKWILNGEVFTTPFLKFSKGIGTYNIKLISTTELSCSDSAQETLNVWEVPTAKYEISDTSVCVNKQNILFKDISFGNEKISKIIWMFGNTEKSELPVLNYKYPEDGYFRGIVKVINIKGCRDSTNFNIRVHPAPEANFRIFSEDTAIYPVFYNHTFGAVNYNWDFGNGIKRNSSDLVPISDIVFDYKNPFYDISLKATNEFGCTDDTIQRYGTPQPLVYIPNAFSPNNEDGRNDEFLISCKKCLEYNFEIYNRWGEHLYSSVNSSRFPRWSGKNSNGGRLEIGTYLIMYSYKDLSGHLFLGKNSIYVLE